MFSCITIQYKSNVWERQNYLKLVVTVHKTRENVINKKWDKSAIALHPDTCQMKKLLHNEYGPNNGGINLHD